MGFQNVLVAQSGGPTTAINATLAGVIKGALESERIEQIYGSLNGIEGVLHGRIIDIRRSIQSQADLKLLSVTPAMALGSCRFRLPKYESDPAIFETIGDVFERLQIGYFFYIGGNDSMDTAHKLSDYFAQIGRDIRVIGIPKTIDNDLPVTDHTPGFGCAAKYIATAMAEIIRDCEVYLVPSITIVEIMGRNAGWLTAAAALPNAVGESAPHLVYLPEAPFDAAQFLEDVKEQQRKHKCVIVAVSEGVKNPDGTYAAETFQSGKVDAFGHKYLSGVGKYLETLVSEKIGCKVRSIELNVLQRCAAHIASKTDIDESVRIGAAAVTAALGGETGKFMMFRRVSDNPYAIKVETCEVALVANQEKVVPKEWINDRGNHVTNEVFTYLMPLIQGSCEIPLKDGLPVHFQFDKTLVSY